MVSLTFVVSNSLCAVVTAAAAVVACCTLSVRLVIVFVGVLACVVVVEPAEVIDVV